MSRTGGQEFRTFAGSSERIEIPLIGGEPDGEGPPDGLTGDETMSALCGPGAGLPAIFAPAASYRLPFSPSVPWVVLEWVGSDTAGIDPATYEILLTIEGTVRRVGRLVVEGPPSEFAGQVPLIGIAEARELTGGAIDALDKDAADVLRALRSSTRGLLHDLAIRYAAGRCGADTYQTTRDALGGDGFAILADNHDAREVVAWGAVKALLFVPSLGDAADEYRQLRREASDMMSRHLGRINVSIVGLGAIRMGIGSSVRAVR